MTLIHQELKRLRIDVEDEGHNAYHHFEPGGYSESAADYNLVDDNPEMAYIPTYPESEHEMFGKMYSKVRGQ